MSDQEINDLLSTAWGNGTCIAWGREDESDPDDGTVIPFDPSKPSHHEPFSVALKYIHQNKLNGDYIETDFDIQLKCGGKNGKFWKLKTKDSSYTVSYGKLYNNKPRNPNTATKSFSTSDECYKEAQKKIKEKKRKKYKVDWDKSPCSKKNPYNNEYLELALKIDKIVQMDQVKSKQFAENIHHILNDLFDGNICDIISTYCNQDKIDHYNCDKVFDDIRMPNTPITRLSEGVETASDKAPSGFDIHLFDGIYGQGQTFGCDVCYGSIRVFSPKEMKLFATRMIKRLMNDEDENIKDIIFGVDGLQMDKNRNKKRKMDLSDDIVEPSLKKRKLNDLRTESVEDEIIYGDDVIYKVAYGLSTSGIFDEIKQGIVWNKVFTVNDDDIYKVKSTYEGNHSLCALCFGLNAAAMNKGVIAHYW